MDFHGPMIAIAGQSNALGYLNVGVAPYCPTARVQIWTDTNGDGTADAWNYMLPGVNTGTLANPTAWGPEVEIANQWLDHNPDGFLWIIKNGDTVKGSVGLMQDPNALDWSPDSTGEMYDRATATIKAGMANVGYDHLDGLFWFQGETDATSEVASAGYADNLREFLQDAREDWSVTDVVMSRITATGAYSEAVRVAQWQVDQEDDHLASFKTIGFDMQPDNLHYSAAGHVALGHAAYDNWVIL